MKLSLPVKLTIFVILLFAAVILSMYLYNPISFWRHKQRLCSKEESVREKAANSIVSEGEKSIPYIVEWIESGESRLIFCSVLVLCRMLQKDSTALDSDMEILQNAIVAALEKNQEMKEKLYELIRSELSLCPISDPPPEWVFKKHDLMYSKGMSLFLGYWKKLLRADKLEDWEITSLIYIDPEGIRILQDNYPEGEDAARLIILAKKSPDSFIIMNNEAAGLLHFAAMKGYKRAVGYIAGDTEVDINGLTDSDRTPLDYALEEKRIEIAALLRSLGAKTGEELKKEMEKK
ncbi:MAG: hypothetical protein E3J72_11490 [Planctomycetota bacterium]|nr:MAG: hypothetical protein E3J72_11490 [Planctomycetota bacterium]